MKILTKKSEITAANLKADDCNYKGYRLGFDKDEGLYFVGRWFNAGKTYHSSISDLLLTF